MRWSLGCLTSFQSFSFLLFTSKLSWETQQEICALQQPFHTFYQTLGRHSKKSVLFNYQTLARNSNGVCSPTVRIIAFQAIDPGSTPGKRRHFSVFFVMLCDILYWLCILLLLLGQNQN
nr:hypothetical protein MARPO_0199s0011 [Ipomoea batatas]